MQAKEDRSLNNHTDQLNGPIELETNVLNESEPSSLHNSEPRLPKKNKRF